MRLGGKTSQEVRKLKVVQREVVTLRAQLRTTSSQDEFARWAKLGRELDRQTAELGKLSKNLVFHFLPFLLGIEMVLWKYCC